MATSPRVKARSAIGNFFLIAGLGFVVVGVVAVIVGGAAGLIAGGTFLMIGVIWAAVALGLRAFYGGMAKKAEAERQLFESGTKAAAVIESVETTGLTVNDVNQQIILRLRVQPRSGAEFPHERKMLVPFHGMPRTGDTIQVAYNPSDQTQVALETDWRSDTAGGRLLITSSAAPAPAAAPAAVEAPAAAPAKTAPERVIEQLERLQRLRDEGALTDSEFAVQKAKVLSGSDV
jgi:Short C-terminal domain